MERIPTQAPVLPARRSYFQLTRTGTYSFLAALPLLLAYEVLIVVANAGARGEVRVGAEVWIKQLLSSLGVAGLVAAGAVVAVVGIGILLYERRKNIPIRARYFGWMLAESVVYAFVLAALVSSAVGMLFAAAPAVPVLQAGGVPGGFLTQMALSLGAGLYEELLFRVLLVGGLFRLLGTFVPVRAAYAVAALVGALLFSAVHYTGPYGDPFALPSFTFRFLFGLALNAVYLIRGFGIAAWTHALYDVALLARLLT